MIKRTIILSSVALFIGCKPNKSPGDAANSVTAEKTTATIPAKGLTGIWSKEGDDNPAFEINQDSVYYPDHAASHPYDRSNDTIMIHYKEFVDTLKTELKGNDTLILSNKQDGRRVYHRYKN